MIDIIIITVIAIAVFFIVRHELRRLRRGRCCGDCAGCGSICKDIPAGKKQEQ